MRKIMCLVLTVICLLALAGCGGGTKNAEAPVQKQAAEKVLRVGSGCGQKNGLHQGEFRRLGIQQPVAFPAGRAGGCSDFLHDDYG